VSATAGESLEEGLRITRRQLLKLVEAMTGVGLALPLSTLSVPLNRVAASASVRSPSVEPFRVALPVPPVLKPVRTDAETDYYEVIQKAQKMEILPGLKTEVWGYEGVFPGPTIEARNGRKVVIRQWNELSVPVSTHLHGGVTQPESDGYPTDLILPVSKAYNHSSHSHGSHASALKHFHGFEDYRYPNEQRAATRVTGSPLLFGFARLPVEPLGVVATVIEIALVVLLLKIGCGLKTRPRKRRAW
jgi:spore coat protein A